MNYITSNKNDLHKLDNCTYKTTDGITIYDIQSNYKTTIIKFNHINDNFKKIFIKILTKYLLNYKLKHIFIVGLGNDSHTADSVGPKTLKHIHANSHLKRMHINIDGLTVSTLEPGTLNETGIEAKRIIESVKDEIKPDLVLIIDAYISDDINFLNKSIEITNEGIIPGSGIKGLNCQINEQTLNIPVVVIGVPTAILVTNKSSKDNYLLCNKDIDNYVANISKLIGESINEITKKL